MKIFDESGFDELVLYAVATSYLHGKHGVEVGIMFLS